MRYFQYRRRIVPDWCRFAHIRCSTSESQVISWCRQTFEVDEVEDCSPPDGPESGLPSPAPTCTDCFVRFVFRDSSESIANFESPDIPARIDTPGQMSSAMLLLRQELTYEAHQISCGDVDTARLKWLAAETEQLARALRRFGWLAAHGRNRS
jgi:hypothetical protein